MDIQNRFSVTFDAGTIPYSGTFPNVTLVRPFEANGDGFTDILLLTDNYGNTDQRSNAYLLTGRSDGGFDLAAELPGQSTQRTHGLDARGASEAH